MTNEAFEYSIAKLSLNRGDIAVLKFDRTLSSNEAANIHARLKPILNGIPVLLLDHTVDLSLLTAEEIAKRVTDDYSRARAVSLESE